jgi:DNA repair exonuclease SbcCD ATPase subunit
MNISADRLDEFEFGNSSRSEEMEKLKKINDELNKKLEGLYKELDDKEAEIMEAKSNQSKDAVYFDKQILAKEETIRRLESENEKLKKFVKNDLVDEWKQKFDEIISENSKLRDTLAGVKNEVVAQNVQIIRMKESTDEEVAKSLKASTTLVGAALTDIQLDPFRAELVRQYGSFESALRAFRLTPGKRLTMTEIESVCLSFGYTREYCKKLFYALDTRNRGFLTMEQFARPLPVINKELCLLMKESPRT